MGAWRAPHLDNIASAQSATAAAFRRALLTPMAPTSSSGPPFALADQHRQSSSRLPRPMTDDRAAKRQRVDTDDRHRAVTILCNFANDFLSSVPTVLNITHDEGPLAADSLSIGAIFAPKSTRTIVKRAGSL